MAIHTYHGPSPEGLAAQGRVHGTMGRLRRLPGAAAGVERAQGGTRSRDRCRRSRGDERTPGRAAGDVMVEIESWGRCQSIPVDDCGLCLWGWGGGNKII